MPNDASASSIAEINALSEEAFVARFGFLFENSPWVVDWAAGLRPFKDTEHMFLSLIFTFDDAGEERWLDVLRAHPKLADKAGIAAELTRESASEQASAGLDSLTPDEFARFHDLNAAYEQKFGFPFIICVRRAGGKAGILKAMQARLDNTPNEELANGMAEVGKIVRLRLEDEVSK